MTRTPRKGSQKTKNVVIRLTLALALIAAPAAARDLALSHGEVFGEIGILEETRRTADVRARSDVEVLALDWRDFKDLLDASNPTARDFMRIVEQRRAALPA